MKDGQSAETNEKWAFRILQLWVFDTLSILYWISEKKNIYIYIPKIFWFDSETTEKSILSFLVFEIYSFKNGKFCIHSATKMKKMCNIL